MLKRMVLGLLLVLLPGVALGQTAQEAYLPAKSQIYFRWDGMQAHRADFDKTALGKMMQGDTGKFVNEAWAFAQENIKNAAQLDPKIEPVLKDVTKLLGTTYDHGLVIAVAVEEVNPPTAQAVIVFPKGAGESGAVMPLIVRVAEEAKAKIDTIKVGKRFVNVVDLKALKIAWWAEGNDAVLFLGNTDPGAYAKAIDAKQTGIGNHPLYKKVASFKEFPTAARGFIDVASAMNLAGKIAPQADKIIDELGLKGLKSITFLSGFDGLAERSVIDKEMSGPRKGLLNLTGQKKISLKSLPILPDDITGFSAGSSGLHKYYGEVFSMIDGIARVFDADKADQIKDLIKNFEGGIGVDFDRDLFANFGNVHLSYDSPSDGILFSGATGVIQVKDGKKIVQTLDKIVRAIPATPVGELALKKTPYRGGEIINFKLMGQTNSHLFSIGLYKDWLVYSKYPQAVKGFILRQEGVLPPWKADPALTKALTHFPSEFNAITISDPRPTVQAALALAPFVFDTINGLGSAAAQFGGGGQFMYRPFDIETIPHPREATLDLFPNVTMTIDDGKRVRTETRTSIGF